MTGACEEPRVGEGGACTAPARWLILKCVCCRVHEPRLRRVKMSIVSMTPFPLSVPIRLLLHKEWSQDVLRTQG